MTTIPCSIQSHLNTQNMKKDTRILNAQKLEVNATNQAEQMVSTPILRLVSMSLKAYRYWRKPVSWTKDIFVHIWMKYKTLDSIMWFHISIENDSFHTRRWHVTVLLCILVKLVCYSYSLAHALCNKNYFVLRNLGHFPDKPPLFPKELSTDAYTCIHKSVNFKKALLYTSEKENILVRIQV